MFRRRPKPTTSQIVVGMLGLKIKLAIAAVVLLLGIIGIISLATCANAIADVLIKRYAVINHEGLDSKANFVKSLQYMTGKLITVNSEGITITSESYTHEDGTPVNPDADVDYTDPANDPNAPSGGGAKTWTSDELFISVADAGLKEGQQTSQYINVSSSQKIPLYDGLPWACNDEGNSYMVVMDSADTAWKEFFNSSFNTPWPNGVLKSGYVEDNKGSCWTNYPGIIQDNYAFNYSGKKCMGFAVSWAMLHKQLTTDNMTVWASEAAAHKYAIVFKGSNGQFYYAPAIASDAKGHTWPGGLLQTFVGHSGDNYYWPGETTNDIAHITTSESDALSALIACSVATGHGGNKRNTVQCTLEGNQGSGASLNGFTYYGVVVYSDR